jgi:hypothetical protein
LFTHEQVVKDHGCNTPVERLMFLSIVVAIIRERRRKGGINTFGERERRE